MNDLAALLNRIVVAMGQADPATKDFLTAQAAEVQEYMTVFSKLEPLRRNEDYGEYQSKLLSRYKDRKNKTIEDYLKAKRKATEGAKP
jgi:hypothetical protein